MSLRRLLPLALAAAATPGCAWLLGHAEPPQPRDPVRPVPVTIAAVAGPLTLEATWLGPGERVVTARNLVGRAARVVNPYGEDTFRIRLVARASGADPVVLLPERATLGDAAGPPRRARTLAAFRARWPAWAVTSDEQDADRQAAMAHVLDTLLVERGVPAGRETAGILAFAAFRPVGRLVLTVPHRVGLRTHEATLAWEGL
jgi:hypothetical protein